MNTPSQWIRSNVIGLLALFVALSGSAVAAQVAEKQVAKPSAKAKKGPRGPRGPAGAQGPPGPATGPAGGELAGNYPNPTVGTVAGLDLAGHSGSTGGIEFTQDLDLYRLDDPDIEGVEYLSTNDTLFVAPETLATGSFMTPAGNAGVYGTGGNGFITIGEGSVSQGFPNFVRLAARDVGGATQLVAVFSGPFAGDPGDIVPLATDPNP